jgi:uncharacterized protein (DUF1697 family)
MPRYALLLKGINVGGNKKIAMADLRALLSDLGFTDVRTLLNSGNAVLTGDETDPERLASRIETAIADRFGMRVRCLVRTGEDLRRVIAGHPLRDVATNGSRMMALFLFAVPDPALMAEHDPTALAPAHVHLRDGVVYQWCPDGILEAPDVAGFVEKRLEVTVTARNWNTVEKLSALLE